MRFDEAQTEFRELEARFFAGELAEGDFLDRVSQLRVTDAEGREWIISARNGRWLVHDGRQWVYARPSQEEQPPAALAGPPLQEPPAPRQTPAEMPSPAMAVAPQRTPAPRSRLRFPFRASQMLSGTLAALLIIACLLGAGVSAWVLFLRDLGEPEPTSLVSEASTLAPVETYTPRPATPTYTPTPTPTPSRTPTPTVTPLVTNTPRATSTPRPQPTSSPTPAETQATAPVVASVRTYTVQAGETLSEIASRFGISVDALAQANGITNPALVREGQVLVIPSPAATPTWTPIVLVTASATSRMTATSTPATTRATSTPTPTRATSTPTVTATALRTATPAATATARATSGPTNTPTPRPTATSRPVALSGKIAFTVWNASLGKYELYVSRIDGTGRNRLGEGYRQPQFRRDGNMLAVNGDGRPNFEHLVMMNPSGGEVMEVSNYSEDAFPTWSPTDNIVAYSSLAYGDGQSRLGIAYDIYGKNQNWIPISTTEIRGEYPFWMQDGRIVYHGCAFLTDHGACGLFWVASGGGEYHRLTTDNSDTAPAGFGSRVAFMSSRDGDWDVYTVNMDGSGLKRLSDNSAQDGLPTWSPDGRAIAFVSNRSGAWAIWVMDADGGNQRKLFDLGGGFGSGDYSWTYERISWAP